MDAHRGRSPTPARPHATPEQKANERVAAFILEMAERAEDHRAVQLSMSRQDIADYLGLAIETVMDADTSRQGSCNRAAKLPPDRVAQPLCARSIHWVGHYLTASE